MTYSRVRSTAGIHFSHRWIFAFTALMVLSWTCVGVLAYRGSGGALAWTSPSNSSDVEASPAASPATMPTTMLSGAPGITESKSGPWGKMQLVPIVLELPDEFATAERASSVRDHWTFTGMSRDAAVASISACGLTTEQMSMLAGATWQESPSGVDVEPPDALVLDLSPETRAALYGKLMLDPANKSAIDPSFFREGRVDFRLRASGLSDPSVAMIKRLLYPGADGVLLFNDIKPSLRAIGDSEERMRFLKAVTRKRSLMARLIVDPNTDTAALAEYWGQGGRQKELIPLLASMKFNAISGVENPSRINIASLLPSFVQERLYRHPDAEQPAGRVSDDCFWTAFNFFNETPDDRIHDMNYLAQMIQRDYVKISEPSKLGDVILIADAKGDALHAANYIADDVVFTKNGFSGRQPWMLAPMRDVISQYRIKNTSLTIGYFRKRSN